MQFTITCPSCSRGNPVDDRGRVPPWCSACGASLSRDLAPAMATPPAPPPPAAVRAVAAPVKATLPQPAAVGAGGPVYFQACVPQIMKHEQLKLIRFYVADGHLLAFPAGFGSIRDGQFVNQNHVSRVIGGIGHGAVMLNATRTACELQSLRDAEHVTSLEGWSEEALVQMALTTSGAVVIPAAELRSVRIEAPGTWFALSRGIRCTAILKLNYENFGTLALPSLTDARRAVEGLTELLGIALEVNLPWGARRSPASAKP